jgi:hypothetical protein
MLTFGEKVKFDAHGVVDGNNGPRFEYKSRKHRAEFMNSRRTLSAIPADVPSK